MFRESGGAFGVREAAMEEQYFRRLVYFTLLFGIYILKSTVKVMISSSVVSQFLLEFARGSQRQQEDFCVSSLTRAGYLSYS